MKKLLLKSFFVLTAFSGLITTQTNAQNSWEFKDAATGTNTWSITTNIASTAQKSNSVVYTTDGSGTGSPTIETTSANIYAGADTNGIENNDPSRRRLFAITLRVSDGGPTLIRVVYPKLTGTGNYFKSIVITTGDANFKTYYVDLGGKNDVNTSNEDWWGTKNDFKLEFKVAANTHFTTAGATIEVDRIEFVNNVFKGTASSNGVPTGKTGNNGNWVFNKPSTDGTEDVLFPSGTPESPLVNSVLNVKSISLGAGVTLAHDAGSNVTVVDDMVFGIGSSYVPHTNSTVTIGGALRKVEVKDNNWHLISSPVDTEEYDDAWVTANGIESGTGNNRGVSTYDNGTLDGSTGPWRYYQAGAAATTFGDGVGYALKATDATGDIYEFTGTYQAGTISPAITQDVTNYNLVGNPYNAYIDVAAFITENTTKLPASAKSIYVWDAVNSTYKSLTSGYLQPGQGFFVDSDVASDVVDFTPAMQGHDGGATFYRSSETSIKLAVTNGESTRAAAINYMEGKTSSLDPRFDIALFTGVPSDLSVYTHLLENNDGIAFERQALPNTDLASMVIPVGVKADANKEITFSAEAMNLPTGIKVFLEDRVHNTFTRLDEANATYKVTLTAALDGVGRFYVHTTQSALSIDNVTLTGVSIFKANAATLRVTGLTQGKASISLFNVLGKQVMSTSFEATASKDISLPKLARGIYFVKVQTATGELSKKIILE